MNKENLCLKLLLPIASCLFVLVLVESATRIYIHLSPQPPQSAQKFRSSRPPPYQEADYFSKKFIRESFSQPGNWEADPSYGWIPHDFAGAWFNVRDGKRVTIGQPEPEQVRQRILFFGGSTVYCSEVPDNQTLPSHLQRMLNEAFGPVYQVENYGATTVTMKQQFGRLKLMDLLPGDIVLFYDGVNDIIQSLFYQNPDGAIIAESRGQYERMRTGEKLLFKIHEKFSPYSEFAALFLNPIKAMASAGPQEFPPESVERFAQGWLETLTEINAYCAGQGVLFFHFLQPHLFSVSEKTGYEMNLLANGWLTPPNLDKAFALGHPALQSALNQASRRGIKTHDLSRSFDGRSGEIFLDFCHVTHQGNQLAAQQIFQVLGKFLQPGESSGRASGRQESGTDKISNTILGMTGEGRRVRDRQEITPDELEEGTDKMWTKTINSLGGPIKKTAQPRRRSGN